MTESVREENEGRSEQIVVTGGAGFIGSHVVGLLLQRGHRVVVLDDFSTGKQENLAAWRDDDRLEVLRVDVSQGVFEALDDSLGLDRPVDRIIHLAAQVSVVASVERPLDDIRLNYVSTAHVLEYARQRQVKKVVFASSAATYGELQSLPAHEHMAPLPLSPYGANKLASERLLDCYSRVLRVPTVALRFFNVYGPRQDPSSPYSGVISSFLDRATRGEPVVIYGDGEQTRDFVYVGDVAQALAAAAARSEADGVSVNIGTGRQTTINRLAQAVLQACNSTSPVHHEAARAGEIRDSVAAIDRARQVLDFTPSVDLDDGLARTAAWFRTGLALQSQGP